MDKKNEKKNKKHESEKMRGEENTLAHFVSKKKK